LAPRLTWTLVIWNGFYTYVHARNPGLRQELLSPDENKLKMEEQSSPWLESWRRHERTLIFALDRIPEPWLADTLDGEKRQVGGIFAYIHQVRRVWLQVGATDIWEKGTAGDQKKFTYRHYLKNLLEESAEGMAGMLERGMERGHIKGFKLDPINFLAHQIARESHYRAEALMILRLKGRDLGEELSYGLWDWGKR